MNSYVLLPRQPYHLALTQRYTKKIALNYGISHFYECQLQDGVSEIPTSVPDGCIDVMFYWNENMKIMGADVLGTLLHPHAVKVHMGCHYFGVRFLPGQKFVLGNISYAQLVEADIPFGENKEQRRLIESIATAHDFEGRIEAFMKVYLPRYMQDCAGSSQDKMNRYVMSEIMNRKGNIQLKELADCVAYSERYVSRSFAATTGITPKKFCRIIRFQNALSQLEEHYHEDTALSRMDEMGYFDEAHFIHDFKEFSGKSPGKFLKEIKKDGMLDRLTII